MKKCSDCKIYNDDVCLSCMGSKRFGKIGKIVKVKNLHYRKRAVSKKAQPAWFSSAHIINIYSDARKYKQTLDHIIPLNGEIVCGLHTHENLQILTEKQNVRKDNNFRTKKVEELMMFDLHRKGRTDKIPKDYLNVKIL